MPNNASRNASRNASNNASRNASRNASNIAPKKPGLTRSVGYRNLFKTKELGMAELRNMLKTVNTSSTRRRKRSSRRARKH